MTAETRSIQAIPEAERHGRARDLFVLWFGANLMALSIATGALATATLGLPMGAAVVALCLGNLVGGVVMALHAAQGPRLGIPQMIQSRGQFGAYGAVGIIAIVAFMDVGFFASNLVLSAQSAAHFAPGLPAPVGIAVAGVAGLIAASLGHDAIHEYAKVVSALSGVAIVGCLAYVVLSPMGQGLHWTGRSFTAGAFVGVFSIAVLWQIAYAPYVSDYSRYLPVKTGSRDAFYASFLGCALGSALPMALGAALGELLPTHDVVDALAVIARGFAPWIIGTLTLAIVAITAMTLYSAALSCLTIIQTYAGAWSVTQRARLAVSIMLAFLGIALAIAARGRFMETYTTFLLFLLYFLTPWTAINLVDYYLIRHGEYDLESLLSRDGGVYGRYNGIALTCYGLGTLVQVPFVSSELYTGPVARWLGGADISWVIGLVMVGAAYYVLMQRRKCL